MTSPRLQVRWRLKRRRCAKRLRAARGNASMESHYRLSYELYDSLLRGDRKKTQVAIAAAGFLLEEEVKKERDPRSAKAAWN